jgi:hypothetical protein
MVLESHLECSPILEHDAFLKHDPGKNADFSEAGHAPELKLQSQTLLFQ